MSPDPDDPRHRAILTLEDAKRIFMEHAMGMHAYRVSYHGDRYEASFTDVFCTTKGARPQPMDIALSIIKREVLWMGVSIGLNKWGQAYIVLFNEAGKPIEPETFAGNELQRFCLRIMELCAAWEGVDRHLDT